jgi:hypothetical protein
MEPSKPARYPDDVVARWVALAAEVRNELVTSDSDGGGAAAAEVVGVGLVV